MNSTVKIKRSELYQQVWEQPMMRLAKNYGISDVGLAKICRKHDIPRPPRGYWAKIQSGRKPKQIPLPEKDRDDDIEFHKTDIEGTSISCLGQEIRQQFEDEKKSDMLIRVADSLHGSHDLVRKANHDYAGLKTNEQKIIMLPEDPPLEVRTSKALLRRGLFIMDALLKALEKRGYQVSSGPKVIIQGIALRFCLHEKLDTQPVPIEEQKQSGLYEFHFSRQAEKKRVPSSSLILEIHPPRSYWSSGCQRIWRETPAKPLEGKLNSFVSGLIKLAARYKVYQEEQKRKEELRRQEEQLRKERAIQRAERQKIYKEELARFNDLLKQAEDYHKSKLIRELVDAVQKDRVSDMSGEEDQEIEQWVAWATSHADRLDPLKPSPPSILDEEDLEEEETQGFRYEW